MSEILTMNKKKICVVVASRANYGRVKYLMKAIKEHEQLELQLIVGASTLLARFGRAVDIIRQDGFEPDRSIHYVLEGETLLTQAKSTGMGIVELSTAFDDLKPDAVVTVADRFETKATAIAATYLNIPLIHLQGGEVSGNIDDRVRHAISKLSDFHFVCSSESKERVIRMGEEPETVFNHGCPAMDVLVQDSLEISNPTMKQYSGVGSELDWDKDYILVVQHPVTTSYGQGLFQINQTLESLRQFSDIQKVVLWPNIDAGSDDVSKGIRVFREQGKDDNFRFFKNFSAEDYGRILANAKCCVGNSSSFIREASFLGIPAVIIGDRQIGREHGINVVHATYDINDIKEKVSSQLEHGAYERDTLFGSGDAGVKIAAEIAGLDLGRTKRLTF